MATHRALRIKLALHEDKATPEIAVAELPGQPYGAAPTLLLPAGRSVLQPCEPPLPAAALLLAHKCPWVLLYLD